MRIKLILTSLLTLLATTTKAQDDELFNRLQGISNYGTDFFNVDGIDISYRHINAEFSIKSIKRAKSLGIKESELITSDSLLGYPNYYITKTMETAEGFTNYATHYLAADDSGKLNSIIFTSHNKNNGDFERKFVRLLLTNAIPHSVYVPTEIDSLNFADRWIKLGRICRWQGVNNVQCQGRGQMNWSVHKTLASAQNVITNHIKSVEERKGGKVATDTTVNVVFEGQAVKARKLVYDFTGVKGLLTQYAGAKYLTMYFVAAPVRGNYISCVMSHWDSDVIMDNGLPPLLNEVMKLQ